MKTVREIMDNKGQSYAYKDELYVTFLVVLCEKAIQTFNEFNKAFQAFLKEAATRFSQ